jgi:hypothetical protein
MQEDANPKCKICHGEGEVYKYFANHKLISLDEKYRNDDLWRMVESDILPKGTIIEDQDKNQMIFTGKAFQIYYSKLDDNEKFIGFCKGDLWEIIDVDEKELENTMG